MNLSSTDYNRVINSSKTDATYKITDISLEYDIVTQPKLARSIRSEYDKMVLLLDNKYALWLDFRTIDEKRATRMGRQIGNISGGINIRIEKKVESAGALKAYIYLIMDAQLNSQGIHLPNHGCSVEHPKWCIRFCSILDFKCS